MADLITINTDEINGLIETLKTKVTKAQFEKILLRLGGIIGAAAESRARQYPRPSKKKLPKIYTLTQAFGRQTKPYQSIFKSPAQAAFVMLGLRDGTLIVPYKRTGTLGKSISHRVERTADGIRVIVGTNLIYAKRVIGDPPDQSLYHQGTWTPLRQAVANPDAIDNYQLLLKLNLTALLRELLKP